MKNSLIVTVAVGLLTTSASLAQQPSAPPLVTTVAPSQSDLLVAIPAASLTVTDWYKQNIFDMANTKVGDIDDVLVSPSDGRITALIVGVGGFLGMGEKHVAISFNAIRRTTKDNKNYLTINTTKDALGAAPGFEYDRNASTWVAAKPPAK